ncbi:hypothetical protein Poli38472_012473 [Pythium oligandrum]|uniref:NmrA-like domain-containing protein n=1 Tax=Pythium oligandrum TaxID=41045 RepID=A0A8K1CPG1_PYTOL|nr:hypothetical protein Poli38472_012473 [Pythium oligandrum]|eukprot:TMW67357.1 hypothetical protein Poli38472_012473 [Pythium oligandrum]
MRKLMNSRVVVVFGATSRIGKATIERLAAQPHLGVTAIAAVEDPKEPRVKRLKQMTGCYVARCDFNDVSSMQRVVRNADAVLLIPALSESGTRFSKRVIDAVNNVGVTRLVIISSILATEDFWRPGGAPSASTAPNTSGYEAVEAHARNLSNNCVALRIPLLMETILYCREEILFANRFLSCFDSTTPVPCIAVRDVALAATEVLTQTKKKYNPTYCLANAEITCSTGEMERLFSQALGRKIKYHQVSEKRLTKILKEKGASELIAVNMIRYKNYLEGGSKETTAQQQPSTATGLTSRLGYTQDFRLLTKHSLMTPRHWLHENLTRFVRTPQNQMQLFVVGSGEGLFQEVERFIALQVTAPLAMPEPDVGEAAIPTATGVAQQSKATFCTIKSIPGHQKRQVANVSGQQSSPMTQLLNQLTSLDVVLFIPPLRLGAQECMDVLRVVVDAARRANVWGIVIVSSLFTGQAWKESINRMAEMEQFVERSGVPYAILRLPLFMEYFLALSTDNVRAARETAAAATSTSGADEEKQAEPEQKAARPQDQASWPHREQQAQSAVTEWTLLDRALASSPQYLISTTDAAKALVSMAYTFPIHRKKVRLMYTECQTMHEIETVLQRYSHRGAHIDFARIDAIYEEPGREFWRIAYWTRDHVKHFLETSVQLSGAPHPLEMSETFEELTECEPMTLEKWAQRNSKSYTPALAVSPGRGRRRTGPMTTEQAKPAIDTEQDKPKPEPETKVSGEKTSSVAQAASTEKAAY